MWKFWVDRGGTFTDIVAKQPDGEILCRKFLSDNPEQYNDAAVHGIKSILGISDNDSIPDNLIEVVRMGTTVATNALLERNGDRTVFVTTKGFADVLRIGYQNRPKIFDLNIKLPEVLYEKVIEAQERIDVDGNIITPLNHEHITKELKLAYADGIRSVAIALMHGYQYTKHESIIAQIAQDIGFTQVSVSNEVSPLIKLVSRGDTTVMDAYLSPILQRYVQQVSSGLNEGKSASSNDTRLMFMQSNGGLASADHFRGKDAILSGPAGGVVGMVATSKQAGFEKLIGFDMGGTSTDVTHYAGEFERSFETEVAGVRIRVPMMNINTVAAGGGSILHFDGARYRVGPDSAGADPGPACYGRGGPLTVTDCNVMLGKINPEFFPKVFGPNADQPLDVAVVRQKFKLMAQEIEASTGDKLLTPEEVAAGFLRIAVTNITAAIKKISVQRGYDLTEYTLNSFGGAGGQHACLVADALRIERILIHPYAGVLSAFGIGLADVRTLHSKQINAPLDADEISLLDKVIYELTQQGKSELEKQHVGNLKIDLNIQLHLRYAGSHQTILVTHASEADMRAEFEFLHKQRYGFYTPGQIIYIEAVTVEAIAKNEESIKESDVPEELKPLGHEEVIMVSDGKKVNAPLYNREDIHPGHKVNGPAIIIEPTGTNIIESGWQATMNNHHHLIMTRVVPLPKSESISTEVDPVMLEVFNNLFMSVAEQMGATLANTAYSVNIKERYDFSCAIFDPTGGLVANAPHIPVHLGSMGESVRAIVEQNQGNIKAGDVYMLNDPFMGGTHLPDITVVTPVFDESKENILFFVASRGHHADIGGTTPGSAPPDSKVIEEEGVVINNFKLVEFGQLREKELRELLSSGKYPCRNPDQNVADLKAQIAANETGVNEINKAVNHFGYDVVKAYMHHIQDNAEESVRRAINKLNNSHFSYELDNGSVIKVSIIVDTDKREATIDFTGTSKQVEGNYNAPLSVCKSAVLYVFRTLVDDDIPLNEGCLKPLKIVAPKGSFINPNPPAAVMSGNTEVSQGITDALYGALGILAGSQGTMNNFVYGDDKYQNYETICGGTGAGPGFDGATAVLNHMSNTRITDAEIVELRYPVRIEEFSIRHNSGGKGENSGGDGVIRKVRFLHPMTATVLTSCRIIPPFGVGGAEPGKVGKNYVVRKDGSVVNLKSNDGIEMQNGDLFVIETPGGGGFNQKH